MRAQSNQVDYLCRAIRENEREVLTQHIKEKMDAEEERFMNEAQKEGVKHRARLDFDRCVAISNNNYRSRSNNVCPRNTHMDP